MILLALIFVGLAALGLALLTDNLRFGLRVPLVVCIPFLWVAIWQAAQPPTGWPTSNQPPRQAEFVAGAVREPSTADHDPGEIDLLLTPPGSPRPRLYRLPYSRQLHEQVEAGMRAAKRGERVGLRAVRRQGERGPKVRYVAYNLPPPTLPTKN